MAEHETHVAEYKKKVVANITKLILDYPIIGILNLEGMPTPQLQKMREKLRDKALLTMTKRRLMNLAFDEAEKTKKGVGELKKHFVGMPALLFTKENPFSLYSTLKKAKTPAPAKAGQTAPKDIVVPAGPTSFAPGPIISELAGFGIKSGVENGKIAIKEDREVAKEGDVIDGKLAALLTKLSIEPMEIGLDLVAAFEKGVIYDKKVLDIDEEQFIADIESAAMNSFKLAVQIAYPTKEVLTILIPKAFIESKALALEANIMCDAVAEELVQKAERQMNALNSQLDIKEEAPKKEEGKEVKPEEETPKEVSEPKGSDDAQKSEISDKTKAEEKAPEEKKEEPKEEKKPAEESAPAEEQSKS